MQFLKLYGVTGAVLFACDLVWLGVVAKDFYRRYLPTLLRPDVRWGPGLLFYLLYVAALLVFVLQPALERQSLGRAVVLGAFFGLTPPDMHSSRRTRTISLARRLVAFFARRHTRMSYPEIGRFMGKNHSSIVLAVQQMEKCLREEKELSWLTPAGTKTMPAAKVVKLLCDQFA